VKEYCFDSKVWVDHQTMTLRDGQDRVVTYYGGDISNAIRRTPEEMAEARYEAEVREIASRQRQLNAAESWWLRLLRRFVR
jgi:hypothetical protein